MGQTREPLKPIIKISYLLIIALLLLTIVEGSAVIAGVWRVIAYSLLPANVAIEETSVMADVVYRFLTVSQSYLSLAVPFVFATWLYRMSFNLHQQTSTKMEFTPGWMIGWYFVPFANLVKPFHGMRELWQVSHKRLNADPSILRWWWGLWLVSRFVGESSGQLAGGTSPVQSIINSTLVYIAFDLLNVALDLVALRIVTSIWDAYEKNYIAIEDPEVTIQELKDLEKDRISNR